MEGKEEVEEEEEEEEEEEGKERWRRIKEVIKKEGEADEVIFR